jgi:hypothetical protein
MKEIKSGLIHAFFTVAILFLVAPVLREAAAPDLGTNRDIVSYLMRWQDVGGGTTKPQFKEPILTTATDTVSYITGTERDTTAAFEVSPYMSPTIILNDTSAADDSANVEFFYYSGSDNQFRRKIPNWEEWTLQDSIEVTGQTAVRWIVTSNPISTHKYGVIVGIGRGDNKLTSAVKSRIFWSATQQR